MLESLHANPWLWALVFIGGAIGTGLRDGLGQWMRSKQTSSFPYATLVVNVLGCFLIGLCMPWSDEPTFRLLVMAGFLGGLTTFSTWVWECTHFYKERKYRLLISYTIASYGFGIGAVWVGQWLIR